MSIISSEIKSHGEEEDSLFGVLWTHGACSSLDSHRDFSTKNLDFEFAIRIRLTINRFPISMLLNSIKNGQ